MKSPSLPGLARAAAACTLLTAASAEAAPAAAAGPPTAMDGRWHFHVTPYLWLAGIEGELSVGNVASVPIEKPFSDIWSDLDFALQGHFEGRKDRIGFGFDLMYTNLQAAVPSDTPVFAAVGLEVDVRQVLAEAFALYRLSSSGPEGNPSHLDVLAGARYVSTRTRPRTTTPVAGAVLNGTERTLDWVDAFAGLRGRVPLGSRFALLGRGDIAGLGSKFTWNLEGDLAFRASTRWTVAAGWRHLDIDYEGEGERTRFAAAYDGPRVWFNYAW